MDMREKDTFTILKDFIRNNPRRKPSRPITIDHIELLSMQDTQRSITGNGEKIC